MAKISFDPTDAPKDGRYERFYRHLDRLCEHSANGGVQITYYADDRETTVDWIADEGISRARGWDIGGAVDNALELIEEDTNEALANGPLRLDY